MGSLSEILLNFSQKNLCTEIVHTFYSQKTLNMRPNLILNLNKNMRKEKKDRKLDQLMDAINATKCFLNTNCKEVEIKL